MSDHMTDLERAAFLAYCEEVLGTPDYPVRLTSDQAAFIAGMRART